MSRGGGAGRAVFLPFLSTFLSAAPNYQSGAPNPFEDLVDDDALYGQLQKEGEKKSCGCCRRVG